MRNLIKILSLAWLMIFSISSFANDITVSNVTLEDQNLTGHYCLVEYDLSWDNSWRTTSIPQNWDAAWIFVKYRLTGGLWQHATLNVTASVIPTGSTIDFSSDNKGVFVYRDADGSGTFSLTDIGLRWDYGTDGVNDDASVEVKVFAVEMVYVPQGAFYLGDGYSQYGFYQQPLAAPTTPFLVDGSTITLGTSNGNLHASGSSSPVAIWGPVPATYPTGYNAFYCMKYEISQEQYVDFLNTLTRTQQNARTLADVSADVPGSQYVLSNLNWIHARSGISCAAVGNGTVDPISFFCNLNNNTTGNEADDGQNIPCTYLSWMDLAAYADWAGLRPITEPEYEKACRGPNTPVAYEYAWGNTTIHLTDYTGTNMGQANEQISDLGLNVGNSMNANTDLNFLGPTRCGLFAASSANHTRVETGASYYGIMEMTGNGLEMIVGILNAAGLSFTGVHGDGTLTTEGNANTDYWPGMDGNNVNTVANVAYTTGPGITGYGGIGEKGTSWVSNTTNSAVSDRLYSHYTIRVSTNNMANAPRLVRSAP